MKRVKNSCMLGICEREVIHYSCNVIFSIDLIINIDMDLCFWLLLICYV